MSSQNHTTKMKTAKTSTKKFLNVKPSANSIVILPCLSPSGRDAPRLAVARARCALQAILEHEYEQLECHESADRNDHGNRDLLIDSGHAEAWDSILRLASMSTCPPSRSREHHRCRKRRSIAQRSAVSPRIGASLQESIFPIDSDRMRVAHVVVPIGDHLHRLATSFQLSHDLIGDAPLERHVAGGRAPGAAH